MTTLKEILKTTAKNLRISKDFFEERRFEGVASIKEIEDLRNRFLGTRCFVIGNGPSLNKIDLQKLENEYSFGVNSIFYKTRECGFKPTFYVVEDRHVMADNLNEIKKYDCQFKFFPVTYKKHFSKENRINTIFFYMNEGFYITSSKNYQEPRFSFDATERLYCGQSVTMINLQLAYYLGFEEIYLIGMDFSYLVPSSAIVTGDVIESTDDDPNHFHPEYFGKGKKWHDPKLDNVLKSYKLCKAVYELSNRKIYNATVGGNLELFDRVNFEELF